MVAWHGTRYANLKEHDVKFCQRMIRAAGLLAVSSVMAGATNPPPWNWGTVQDDYTHYPALSAALDQFTRLHGAGETDLSGTARGAFVVQAEDAERDQHLKDLRRMAQGKWPHTDHAATVSADTALNASYRKALVWAGSKDNYSTITADDIRLAQRAWLPYRDAWLRFGAAAAPSLSADAILSRITRLRIAELDALWAQ